jgi:multidrug efflux system membrane fusion protein
MLASTSRPILILAASAFFLAGCHTAAPVAKVLPPTPVTVARATTANVPTRLEAIGSVQPVNTVSVKSLVGGELQSVGFQQGDEVHRGQVLFRIDPHPYVAALAQAQANLARDLANDSQARAEARRYADLARQGIVSTEQNEQLQAAAAADDSVVSADRAAVETAKLNLSYCTITSPIAGRTGSLLVQPGNVVQPNATILVTINQISPIFVSFSVPEQYLLQVKRDNAHGALQVTARAQDAADTEFGRLSFINNAIDNTTGTIQLMATFPNTDEHLWPGEYVNAEVTLSVAENAVVVPSAAVLTGQNDMYVYVLTGKNTVENRVVKPSITVNGMTVITQGIAPGETVVTDGQLALFPGAKVAVQQGPPAPGGSAGGTVQAAQ